MRARFIEEEPQPKSFGELKPEDLSLEPLPNQEIPLNSAYVKMVADKKQKADAVKTRRAILGFILMAISVAYILHTVW